MSQGQVLEIATSAVVMAGKLAGPLLMTALIIGVAVSLIQTVTQIQEMTLSFVPKAIGLVVILITTGHWMLQELTNYTANLWSSIPGFSG